ncbi:Protoporphyrinogen oxidase [Pirellulimonas nuda]|uniref:Coproporphyrinogen III oxidase n=1 Tax=Pirellulimonas nuda TaxID=2528009 RepID=A0A518DE92_9BACT|nr:protoporphyrinogen oxidase [Pirellulimonas nuda]QDU89804.1 Protoporphyrinogen oxidase [Pirellulimonas nuda]
MDRFTGQRRVAVIGGGVSGLAAAHRLRRLAPGLDVRLLESGPRLGGVIRTHRESGFLIEGAADNFITNPPHAVDLCHDLGLTDELIRTNPNGHGAMVVSRGRLEPIPPGFVVMAPSRVWPLLSTRVLSPLGKLRSACELLAPRKRGGDDESLESFVTRRFGREMFERLVQPLVGGIYTADPARLSVAATMPRFLEMERKHGSLIRAMMAERRQRGQAREEHGGARYSQFMTLRGGMSRLIDALGASLPADAVCHNAPVHALDHDGDGWRLSYGDGGRLDADAVVVACPAPQAAAIVRRVDPTITRLLSQIEYASCAVVSLAFGRDQIRRPINAFGFVAPRIEGRRILSCSFSSEKYAGRAPEGAVLMRVFIGGALQPGLLDSPDSGLVELACQELAALLRIRGGPILSHVTRQNHAMPQYHLGHLDRVAQINQRLLARPTLALAGSALNGVGAPGCIASGQEAARRVVAAMESSPIGRAAPGGVV